MMLETIQQETLTHSFLQFASQASNILHIQSEQDYKQALITIEHLFEEAEDTLEDPLNDLIDIVARAIEKYEQQQENIILFDEEAKSTNQELSTLRLLMDQHNLSVADLKSEIGSKSLVSMVLSGKRNLTKEHIQKLSQRFGISPALFFDLRLQ